jgi:hypothetical protein
MYIYVAIASILIFCVVLHIIDKNNIETHKPPLTLVVKIGLFMVCLVVSTVVGTVLWEEKSAVEVSGGYITQEIDTGFPEF